MLQELIHYSLHFLFPVFIAWFFFRENWKIAALIMISTMLVDLDHLLADPIFLATRCSIGFHPLHSYIAIGLYTLLTFFKKTRILGIGFLLHMLTDFIDCLWMRFT